MNSDAQRNSAVNTRRTDCYFMARQHLTDNLRHSAGGGGRGGGENSRAPQKTVSVNDMHEQRLQRDFRCLAIAC